MKSCKGGVKYPRRIAFALLMDMVIINIINEYYQLIIHNWLNIYIYVFMICKSNATWVYYICIFILQFVYVYIYIYIWGVPGMGVARNGWFLFGKIPI